MISTLKRHAMWGLAWGVATLVGATLLAQNELSQQQDDFETNVRITHRLLSQRVLQHDAVLSTLTLLRVSDDGARPDQRLPQVYPQIVQVQRREPTGKWDDEQLNAAEQESRRLNHAVMTGVNLTKGRYYLVQAAPHVSYALLIDVRTMVPWADWPMAPDASDIRMTLNLSDQAMVLQPGRTMDSSSLGWWFDDRRLLPSDSQPFEMVSRRHVGWGDLPWAWMCSWSLVVAVSLLVIRALLRQRHDRQRAEELLRLGREDRVSTLSELATGMAHELKQPLSDLLLNAQASNQLLEEQPIVTPQMRHAVQQTLEQARRAADVVGRLRQSIRPPVQEGLRPVDLRQLANQALYLMEPELKRRHVSYSVAATGAAFKVMADPGSVEQIVHNLLLNALRALEAAPLAQRRVTLTLSVRNNMGSLSIQDSGPGIPNDVLSRIFEPFFSTHEGGLGLGLSLCESLATRMGGSLTAFNRVPHGAEFCLYLPLA